MSVFRSVKWMCKIMILCVLHRHGGPMGPVDNVPRWALLSHELYHLGRVGKITPIMCNDNHKAIWWWGLSQGTRVELVVTTSCCPRDGGHRALGCTIQQDTLTCESGSLRLKGNIWSMLLMTLELLSEILFVRLASCITSLTETPHEDATHK